VWHTPATRRSNRTILADTPASNKFEDAPGSAAVPRGAPPLPQESP